MLDEFLENGLKFDEVVRDFLVGRWRLACAACDMSDVLVFAVDVLVWSVVG